MRRIARGLYETCKGAWQKIVKTLVDVNPIALAEPVDDDDVVDAEAVEIPNQGAADEACATRDKDAAVGEKAVHDRLFA